MKNIIALLAIVTINSLYAGPTDTPTVTRDTGSTNLNSDLIKSLSEKDKKQFEKAVRKANKFLATPIEKDLKRMQRDIDFHDKGWIIIDANKEPKQKSSLFIRTQRNSKTNIILFAAVGALGYCLSNK